MIGRWTSDVGALDVLVLLVPCTLGGDLVLDVLFDEVEIGTGAFLFRIAE